MSKQACTKNGMEAAHAMRKLLKAKICGPDNAFTGTGRNSVSEGEQGELYDTLLAEAASSVGLTRLNLFIDTHAVAPPTTKPGTACVDRMVTLEYEEGETKMLHFVLGGEDEPQLYTQQGVRVIFYGSPLGRKLVGKQSGDWVSITVGGVDHDAEIISIGDTPSPDQEVGVPEDGQLPLRGKVAA